MVGMPGAGRYAPSPSGDLHYGNLRTALLAWLWARSTGRDFRMRVDDIDTQRSSRESAARQLEDLAALGLDWDGETQASASRVLAPLDDSRLMAKIGALERRRRAKVTTLPVILTQENVPAVFQDSHTFYLPARTDDRADWKPVRYGTQVSVLPRFAEANQIEMRLDVEEDRQMSVSEPRGKNTAVGRVGVNSVVRLPPGRRLWLGTFQRGAEGRGAGRPAQVRLFVIQARPVGSESKGLEDTGQPPPLTATQYQRVQRAFVRPQRDVSP